MELIIVKELIKKLYLYDKYTYYHSINVARVSNKIAINMGLKNYTDDITIGCMLHDIGKIKIPKHLLDQTKFYNNYEYSLIKQHVELGNEILKDKLDNNDYIIKSIVCEHHERLNGNGYPYNLKNQDISIFARICAVADTIDAIQSRNYNKKKDVLEELIKGIIDNMYDENVVNVAITLIDNNYIKLNDFIKI